MKTKSKIVAGLAGALLLATGCVGPLYTGEDGAAKGKGWGLFGSGSATSARVNRLAVDKLNAAPAQVLITNGVVQGYQGVVANLSGYNRYNFKLFGPETKSYLLGPGERAVDHLLPGYYQCRVFQGGMEVGNWSFRVGTQQSVFLNQTYHWYVYTDR